MDPGSSSHPTVKPQFFRIILPQNLQDGILELPPKFVKEYGKELGQYVSLEVPEDKPHKVEVERFDRRIWLHQGWKKFADCYSIQCFYMLVFIYEGGSTFHVVVYHTGCTEVDYPVSDDDSDDDDAEIPYESPPQKQTTGNEASNDIQSSMGYDQSIARERAVKRAKAFESTHPHFYSIMRQGYLSRSYLYLPKCPATRYFHGRKDNEMKVNGPDGKAWFMKYYFTTSPQNQLRISFGWREFVKGYRLQDGDVCVFELINRKLMEFKVTIFRVDDEQEGGRRA